jgi:hypothetical protein
MSIPKGFRNEVIPLRHDVTDVAPNTRFMERTDRMKMFQKNQFGKALRQLSGEGEISKAMTTSSPHFHEKETPDDSVSLVFGEKIISTKKDIKIMQKTAENDMLEYSIILNDLSDLEEEFLEQTSISIVNQKFRHLNSSMSSLDRKGQNADDDLRAEAVVSNVRSKSKDRVGSMSVDSSPMRSKRASRASSGTLSADTTPPRNRRQPKRNISRNIDLSPISTTSSKYIDNNFESNLLQRLMNTELGMTNKEGRDSRCRHRRSSPEKKNSRELITQKSRKEMEILFSNSSLNFASQNPSADSRLLHFPGHVGKYPKSKCDYSVDKTQDLNCGKMIDDCNPFETSQIIGADNDQSSSERMEASMTFSELIKEKSFSLQKEPRYLCKVQSQSLSSLDDTHNLTDSSTSVDKQNSSFLTLEGSSTNKMTRPSVKHSLKDRRHSRSPRRSVSEESANTEGQNDIKRQLQKLLLLRQLSDGCSLFNSANVPPLSKTSSESEVYGKTYSFDKKQHVAYAKDRGTCLSSLEKNPYLSNGSVNEEVKFTSRCGEEELYASPVQLSPEDYTVNKSSSFSISDAPLIGTEKATKHTRISPKGNTKGKIDAMTSLKSEKLSLKKEDRASRSSSRSSSADSISTREQRASKRRPQKKILSRNLSDDSLASQERTNQIQGMKKGSSVSMESPNDVSASNSESYSLEGDSSTLDGHSDNIEGYLGTTTSNISPIDRHECHKADGNTHSVDKYLMSKVDSSISISHSRSSSADSLSITGSYFTKRQRQKSFITQEQLDICLLSKQESSLGSKVSNLDNHDDHVRTKERLTNLVEGSYSSNDDGLGKSEALHYKSSISETKKNHHISSKEIVHEADFGGLKSTSKNVYPPFMRDQSVQGQKQREISPIPGTPRNGRLKHFPDPHKDSTERNILEKSPIRRSKSSSKSKVSSEKDIQKMEEKEFSKTLDGDLTRHSDFNDEDYLDSCITDILSDSSARTIQRSNVTTIQKSKKKDRTKAYCKAINAERGRSRNSPKPRKKKIEITDNLEN